MKHYYSLALVACFFLVSTVGCSFTKAFSSSTVSFDMVPVTPIAVPLTSHPGWTSYTNSNQITSIAFDKDGNVWTAGGGLVKWDVENKTYAKYLPEHGLPTTHIASFAFAPDGSLWIADEKLSRFDGNTWVTYDEKKGNNFAIAPNGDIWTVSEKNILRFDGQNWTSYPISTDLLARSITSFAVAPNGLVLLGTTRNGDTWISVFDGNTWKSYPSSYAHSIAFSSDGTIWLGTWNGIEKFDAKTGKSQLVREFRGVGNLVVAPDDKLWFSVCSNPFRSDDPEGVWSFDGKTWRIYTSEDNFISCGVSTIAAAPNGDIWLGTPRGLSRLDGNLWPTYATEDVLAGNDISGLEIGIDGVLWALFNGSTISASRFQDNAWTNYEIDTNPIVDVRRIGPFAPDVNGTAWYGSDGGVLYFDGNNWSTVGLDGEEVRNISVGSNGTVWFGTYNSISSFGAIWETYKCGEKLSCTHIDHVIVSPDGSVWVNARDDGLLHFAGKQWISYRQFGKDHLDFFQIADNGDVWGTLLEANELVHFDGQEWTNFPFPADLKAQGVYAMILTPNTGVWIFPEIAVGNGFSAYHFDGQEWDFRQFPEIVTSEFLTSTIYSSGGNYRNAYFYGSIATMDGMIWIITNGGVLSFDGERWESISIDNGLVSNSVTSIAVGPDGTIWFGTEYGISRFSRP